MVPPNLARFVQLYKLAIEHGDVGAPVQTALPQTPPESVQLYIQAIVRGNVEGLCSLGFLLETGADGVPPNPIRSVELCEKAIDRGYVPALNSLGILLQTGADVVRPSPARSAAL